MNDNSTNSEQQRRDELEDQWRQVKSDAENLSKLGAQIAKFGAEYSDVADIGIEAARHGSPDADWESSIESARRFGQVLRSPTGLMQSWSTFYSAASSSGTVAVDQSSALVSNRGIQALPTNLQREAYSVQQTYSRRFEQSQIKQDVLNLMASLGFAGNAGGRKAIDKFRNAWEIFEQRPATSDPAIGSLLSLRESMRLVVDELIRRRSQQAPARAKIRAIGDSLAFPQVPPTVFDDLEVEYSHGGLQDVLSGAKSNILPRDEETELMQRGTRFLKALLSAVDPARLRR